MKSTKMVFGGVGAFAFCTTYDALLDQLFDIMDSLDIVGSELVGATGQDSLDYAAQRDSLNDELNELTDDYQSLLDSIKSIQFSEVDGVITENNSVSASAEFEKKREARQ